MKFLVKYHRALLLTCKCFGGGGEAAPLHLPNDIKNSNILIYLDFNLAV